MANLAGHAEAFFYDGGPISVHWSILTVAPDQTGACVERKFVTGSVDFYVESGPPELVTQNKFSQGEPRAEFESSDGQYILADYKQRFQVLRKDSGDLVFDTSGTTPKFSTRGRFITFNDGSGRLQILDLVSRQIVFSVSEFEQGNFGGAAVWGWINEDTALLIAYGRKGAVGLVQVLIEDRVNFSGDVNCNACHAFGSIDLTVDFDALVMSAGGQSSFQSTLVEVADTPDVIESWDKGDKETRGPPPKRARYKVPGNTDIETVSDNLSVPANKAKEQDAVEWLFSDPVKIAYYRVWNGDLKFLNRILKSKFYNQIRKRAENWFGRENLELWQDQQV